jgi:16S rRNA (adenine1518-N6/adenine1519-N6)-dimethyltransferase
MGNPLNHRARKRFAQHFLHDPGVIERIIAAIAPRPGDAMVEIGPGTGALTAPLLERLERLEAVELDRDLIPALQRLDAGRARLTLYNQDALGFDFAALARGCGRLRVVGNLPYNISTPLIFHLLGAVQGLQDMHFLLQREVVDRIAARPGGKTYGRLSVMVQYHCEAERLFAVGAGAFSPPPKVDSAFLRLRPLPTPPPLRDRERFERIVAQAFSQRRKTLRNALRGLVSEQDIRAAGLDPARRGETLSVGQFVALANHVAHR